MHSMDKSKDHLAVVYGNSAQPEVPSEAKHDFVRMITEGKIPSKSLRSILQQYSLKTLDHSITFVFLRAAYPGIDLMDEALSSRIIDSGYPDHIDGLSDQEFDDIIERIKDSTDSW